MGCADTRGTAVEADQQSTASRASRVVVVIMFVFVVVSIFVVQTIIGFDAFGSDFGYSCQLDHYLRRPATPAAITILALKIQPSELNFSIRCTGGHDP